MALLIILGLRFRVVSKEAKEYFMVWRREKLGKLRAKLQPTITILTDVNIPKEIFNPTTPHSDSHEDENSLTFDSSPTHLYKKDHNSQNSP
jgi:hypothetical protein